MTLLFESFMVFYLIEVLVLISVAVWYYKEEPKQPQVIPAKITGPSTAQVMAMYRTADKLKREQLRG